METNLYNRVVATLLAIATVALVLFAVFNLQQESSYQQPDDGVVWTESPSRVLPGLIAERVTAGGPGAQAEVWGGLLRFGIDQLIELGPVIEQVAGRVVHGIRWQRGGQVGTGRVWSRLVGSDQIRAGRRG